jgi:hypothetical protein
MEYQENASINSPQFMQQCCSKNKVAAEGETA